MPLFASTRIGDVAHPICATIVLPRVAAIWNDHESKELRDVLLEHLPDTRDVSLNLGRGIEVTVALRRDTTIAALESQAQAAVDALTRPKKQPVGG